MIHLFIYIDLLYKNLLPPPRGRHASTQKREGKTSGKNEEKERDRGTKGETSIFLKSNSYI